jgi:hypothetical protein
VDLGLGARVARQEEQHDWGREVWGHWCAGTLNNFVSIYQIILFLYTASCAPARRLQPVVTPLSKSDKEKTRLTFEVQSVAIVKALSRSRSNWVSSLVVNEPKNLSVGKSFLIRDRWGGSWGYCLLQELLELKTSCGAYVLTYVSLRWLWGHESLKVMSVSVSRLKYSDICYLWYTCPYLLGEGERHEIHCDVVWGS